MIFKDKEIIAELKTIEGKLDQLIAMKKADRLKAVTKTTNKGDR